MFSVLVLDLSVSVAFSLTKPGSKPAFVGWSHTVQEFVASFHIAREFAASLHTEPV